MFPRVLFLHRHCTHTTHAPVKSIHAFLCTRIAARRVHTRIHACHYIGLHRSTVVVAYISLINPRSSPAADLRRVHADFFCRARNHVDITSKFVRKRSEFAIQTRNVTGNHHSRIFNEDCWRAGIKLYLRWPILLEQFRFFILHIIFLHKFFYMYVQ